MNRIIFNTLKLQGFGAFSGYKVFKLNSPGLNVIRGRNGSKKTTIFSALAWCIYGSTLKPGSTPETWEHVRGPNWEGTMVSVSLEINGVKHKITRCKDYIGTIHNLKGGNRLIFEEGGEVCKLKDKRDVQKYIEETLGISFSIFTSSVVFQQKGVRFIEKTGPEKKKILEESFKLTWISLMAEKAREKKAGYERLLSQEEKRLGDFENQRSQLNNILKEMGELRQEFEERKREKVTNLTAKIGALQSTIKNLKEATEELATTQQSLNEVRQELGESLVALGYSSLQDLLDDRETLVTSASRLKRDHETLKANFQKYNENLKSLQDKIDGIKNTPSPTCFACGGPLNQQKREVSLKYILDQAQKLKDTKPSGDLEAIKRKFEETTDSLAPIQERLEPLKALGRKVDFYKDKSDGIREKIMGWEAKRGEFKTLKENLKEALAQEFKDSSPKVKDQLREVEAHIRAIREQVNLHNKRVGLAEWAIKGPLSNTGIKTYLFEQLLSKLNQRLKYYESFTGFSIQLIVDLDSGRKNVEAIISYMDAPVDYKDISGGEGQLVNVIVALAASDVLLPDTYVNLRVFDEVSEHLDKENTEMLSGFLKKLAEDHSVFVITHQDEFRVEGSNEITLTKDGQD